MDELMNLNDIKSEIDKIDFGNEERNSNNNIEENQAKSIIKQVHKKAILETVKGDKKVQEEIIDKAKASIENEMNILDKEETKRVQDATYDASVVACNSFGIGQSVEVWKIKMMKFGHDFWFILYYLIAFFTICPVNVFCEGLKKFIKSNWLVVLTGILMYLLFAIGVPLAIKYVSSR